MLQRVLKRVESHRGASLSMALMLMLACVTVSSVILAAATAAAGRQSQLSRTDQSYYNVTSAAGLFWDKMEASEGVTLERSCVARLNGESWVPDEGSGAFLLSNTFSTGNSLNSTGTAASLFQVATCDAVFGTGGKPGVARSVDSAMVLSSLDMTTLAPRALQPFGPYEVTVDTWTAGGQIMPAVVVTVQGREDGLVTLSFVEKSNPSCTCVLTAALQSGGASPTYVESADGTTRTFTWKDTYTWTPLTMSVEASV